MPTKPKKKTKEVWAVACDPDLKKKVSNYALLNNCSLSEVVTTALNAYLEDDDYWTILFKRLNRERKAISNLERRIEMLIELILLQLQYWFALTPELSSEEFNQQKKTGYTYFTRFLDTYRDSLMKGGLLHEDFETYFKDNFEKVNDDD